MYSDLLNLIKENATVNFELASSELENFVNNDTQFVETLNWNRL